MTSSRWMLKEFAVGLLVTDRRGAVVSANAAARRIVGAGALIDREPFLKIFEHCRQNPRHECREFTIQAGGRIFKIFGRKAGNGFTLAFADITREKRAEESKTEFVALASHQLRTPLSVMKWILEEMAHDRIRPGSAAFAKWFKRVFDSNEQMITLVQDLLNVARLESGKLIPSPADVDLAVLTKHVAGEFKAKILEKKLHYSERLGRSGAVVFADPKFLHEILTNLFSNAVKYTPERGSIQVRVRPGRGRVNWTIQDTGVGIPARERRQVFKKFFRGENVAGTEIEGTGLGLHVVLLMAKASGGKVAFTSKEGRGSAFTVSFPIAEH